MRSRLANTNRIPRRAAFALVAGVCFALLVATAAAAPDQPGAPVQVSQARQAAGGPPAGHRDKLRRPVHARVDPHTILVRFAGGAAGTGTVQSLGDRLVGRAGGTTVVRIGPGDSPGTKVAQYRKRKDVVYAEPNYVEQIDALPAPNDPHFGDQWGFGQIDAIAGWSLFPGSYAPASATPTVAIVDTGIASAHQDLGTAKVLSASGANCITNTCNAWPSSGSTDDNGHGTHVAGIAAAATNNGVGVAGVAFASKVLPVKVCDASGSCPISAIAAGISWAVGHGAKVINMSLGGPGFSSTLCSAVSNALSHGVLVVAAAGNDGTDIASYPASCPGAVGVAAVGPSPDDISPYWSNFGYPNVFVSAPGGGESLDSDADGIWSTVPFSLDDPTDTSVQYQSLHGTSMASPFVAGLGALLFGQAPTRTPTDVKRLIAETATKVSGPPSNPYYGTNYGLWSPSADPFHACTGCTWHGYYGYGEVSLAAALAGPPPVVSSFLPTAATIGSTVTITGQELSTARSVKFGGDVTATPTVVSSTSIKVVVPTGATTAPLEVTTAGGTADSPTALKIAPKIDSFGGSPAQAGDPVTINGSGFDGTAVVKFGTVTAETPTVNAQGTQLSLHVPDTAVTGKVTVTTTGGTAISLANFGVRPTISSLTPDNGAAGTPVTIGGKTLLGVSSVKFSGASGQVAATFSTTGGLKATVPATAITGPIFVTNAGGTTQSGTSFTVLPKVVSITPASGAVDTPVTVTGTGFDSTTVVNVNGTALTIASRTPTQIKGTISAGSTTGNVIALGNTGGVGPLFKVTPKLNLPLSAVQAGDTVTLTGSNLDDPALPPAVTPTLKLGAAILVYTPIDATHLQFTVPDTAVSAKLSFTNKWGTYTTASNLLIKPKILSFSPGDSTAGTPVTITGKTFTGITSVKFNGVAAPFTVSAGAIKANVPTAAMSGPIAVTNAGGTETSADDFVVDPKILSIAPTSGPVGTIFSVSGTGLGGADHVFVGSKGGVIQAGGTANLVKVQVAPNTTTGAVTLTTASSSDLAAGPSFRVLPSVSIGGLSPNPAPAKSTVTVSGFNLDDVASAKLGSIPLPSFNADTPTHATFTLPAAAVSAKLSLTTTSLPAVTTASIDTLVVKPTLSGPPPGPAAAGAIMAFTGSFVGVASVKFTGPAGGDPSVTAAFTRVGTTGLNVTVPTGAVDGLVRIATASVGGFVDSAPVVVLPKVASISATSGVAGPQGPLVTVNGSGFRPGAKVAFGATAPADATFVSSTKMTLRPPLGATSGKLTVTNPSDPVGPASSSSFTVTLSVTGFSPPNPTSGATVTVTGLGFNSSTRVYLGGNSTIPGAVLVVPDQPTTATQLTFKLPGGAPSGTVAVRNGGPYSWSLASLSPSFADLIATEGPTGSTVALDGAGFEDGASVTFAGVSGIPAVVSAGGTHLTFTVPDGAVPASAAESRVEIDNPGGSVIISSGEFTVTLAITGLDRTSGAAGDQVVISGVGFTAGATVSFGGVQAVTTVDGPTQITAAVPDGAASGDVTVTTAAGTVSSAESFAVTGGAASAATDSPQFAAAGTR